MLGSYAKAVEQIGDPPFLKVIALGVVGAAISLSLLWSGVGWLLEQVAWGEFWLTGWFVDWVGQDGAGMAGWFAFMLGVGGLTWVLFPVTAVAVTGLFLGTICEAVENKHYPHRRDAREEPILEAVFNALRFLGTTALLNILALPFYFISGGIVFVLLNGYLVSREFFELVAARRMPPKPARALRKRYQGRLWLFGILAVLMMSVPILNLIAPVLTAAAMVHFYEGLPRKDEHEAIDGSVS